MMPPAPLDGKKIVRNLPPILIAHSHSDFRDFNLVQSGDGKAYSIRIWERDEKDRATMLLNMDIPAQLLIDIIGNKQLRAQLGLK
jgi:hypothetical protein